MTSKLSWIAFVPFTLASIAIKIIQIFFLGENGTFYGLSNLMLSYLAIGCALVVFLFAVIFCLCDKKIAPVYLINRNIICGLFGILLAVCMACESANRAFFAMRTMSIGKFEIVDIIMTVLCAIVFVVLGLNHFVGNGGVKGLAVFYLVPALWSALRLVCCFLEFTTVSIAVSDVTVLVCYIFTTLFLFNYAMIIPLMRGKSPVKSVFVYGLPTVTLLLSYSIYELSCSVYLKSVNFDVFSNLNSIEFLLLAIYILSFILELTSSVKRKDEIEIIEEVAEKEYDDVDDPDADIFDALSNSVTNGNKPDEAVRNVLREGGNEDFLSEDDQVFIDVAQASLNNTEEYLKDVDTSEFIYGQAPSDDDLIMPVETDDTPYVVQADDSVDLYITKADSTYDDEEMASIADEESSLDRIDRLILEISEDDVNL